MLPYFLYVWNMKNQRKNHIVFFFPNECPSLCSLFIFCLAISSRINFLYLKNDRKTYSIWFFFNRYILLWQLASCNMQTLVAYWQLESALGKISNLICEKHSLVIATTSFKFSNKDSRKLVIQVTRNNHFR